MNEKVKKTKDENPQAKSGWGHISEFPLWLRGGIASHVELRNEFVVQLVYAYLGARC